MFKNTPNQDVSFTMALNGTPVTGLTVTVTVTIAGAVVGGGTVSEISGGIYRYQFTQAQTNGDSIGFQATAVGADVTSFPIYTGQNANLTQIDGLETSGNNATLYLKKLDIVNSAGDALRAESSGGGGRGIYAKSNGSNPAIYGVGGTGGNGLQLDGNDGGNGLVAQALGLTGNGAVFTGATGMSGILCSIWTSLTNAVWGAPSRTLTGTGGAGASLDVIDIKIGSTPVANMQVWLTSDASGTVLVAGTLSTDVSGEVPFMLDYGTTYYLWAVKVGVNSIYGQSFVAAATNSFTTTAAAAAGTGLLTLTQARAVVRNSVLHVPNGSYSNEQIDNAILFVGKMWMRDTKCVVKFGQVAIVDGEREIDIQGALPDFDFWSYIRAQIVTTENHIKTVYRDNYQSVANAYCNGGTSGRPRALGMKDNATALLYPEPDDDYTLHVFYGEPFVEFTAGTLSPDSVTINVPADFVRDVLWFGAGTALVFGENYQNMYPTRGWSYFMDLKKKVAGEVSISADDTYSNGSIGQDWLYGNW